MKKTIIFIISLMLCVLALSACGAKKDESKQASDATVATENVEATVDNIETYEIKTKYGDLSFPKEWEEDVTVKIDDKDGYTVGFYAGKTKLFDLQYNCGSGEVLGTLNNDGENVIVRVSYAELDKKSADYDKYADMQNSVDLITDRLEKNYDFAKGDEIYVSGDDVFEIKMEPTSLYYPSQWKDKVTVDVNDGKATFSSDKVKLFDIIFGEADDNAYLVGSYDGTDVYIVSYDIEQGKLSDNDFMNLRAMQESVDVIIDHLRQDEKFKLAA